MIARSDVSDALIFLDAHYSGGHTARGKLVEPACKEIEMLACRRDKIAAVVVDDFRLFGRGDSPRKSELLRAVEENLGPSFDFTVHLDQLLVWRLA